MSLDASAGLALKAQGQQLALQWAGDDWKQNMLGFARVWFAIERLSGVSTMTIERLRDACPHQPASHFAWGTVPALLMREGLIEPDWAAPGVQRTIKAVSTKTRAHPVKVWRICGRGAELSGWLGK